jgi:putative ABC transport system substrate-binding protein
MDRRSFVRAAAASVLVAGQLARADKLPRVAIVFISAPVSGNRLLSAFEDGLRERGLDEGRNIVIERRSAEGQYDRLPALMQELVAASVDVIVTIGPGVGAARRATRTIPIVSVWTDGLVESGAVASLARPGGNVTGLTGEVGGVVMVAKRLQYLHEMAPNASRVAFLGYSSEELEASQRSPLESAASTLGQTIVWVHARTPQDLAKALAKLESNNSHVNALYVEGSPPNYARVRDIASLGATLKLPSIYEFREGPESGGLMSYGSDPAESFRRAASYVDRILKGAKPFDLPIEQPRTFELVINPKTAKFIGLTIPQSLRLQAKLIEP